MKLLVSRAPEQCRYEVLDGFEVYRVARRSNFNFFVPGALRALLSHNEIDIVIDDLNKIPFYSPLFTRKTVTPMLMHLFRKAIYRSLSRFCRRRTPSNIPFASSHVVLLERDGIDCRGRSCLGGLCEER